MYTACSLHSVGLILYDIVLKVPRINMSSTGTHLLIDHTCHELLPVHCACSSSVSIDKLKGRLAKNLLDEARGSSFLKA